MIWWRRGWGWPLWFLVPSGEFHVHADADCADGGSSLLLLNRLNALFFLRQRTKEGAPL